MIDPNDRKANIVLTNALVAGVLFGASVVLITLALVR